MGQKCKVVDVRRIPSPDPQRLGKFDRLVVVEFGEGNRDVVTVPDEDFSEEKLKAAIADLLKQRGGLIGREYEV